MAASDVLYAAFMSDPGAHDERVKRIQRDVKARLSRPLPKKCAPLVRHGRTYRLDLQTIRKNSDLFMLAI